MAEVFAARQNPAKKDGRIHGRHFGVEHAFPGFDVREVIEKAAVIWYFPPQKTQCREQPLQHCAAGDEAASISNAKSRQPEAGGRDAGRNSSSAGTRMVKDRCN